MAADVVERGGRRLEDQGLLFASTVKWLFLAAFFELILYRLVSRLGMHLSKVAEKHEWVRVTFKWLSSMGFTLLNFTSLLVFLALILLLVSKYRSATKHWVEPVVAPSVSLLVLLTVGFLIVPPTMLGTIIYNVLSVLVIALLVAEYLTTRPSWRQAIMVLVFVAGLGGWFYYQIVSTSYGLFGGAAAPPAVHEMNRAGEALMVLASVLCFWAYAAMPLWSRNRRQQGRILLFGGLALLAFVTLLFLDYVLQLYSPELAVAAGKAGEGIGWIFQMGMGYTFYLPFAFYVLGLLCWGYTVTKLTLQGRPAGYGLGLMFIAGYALQLSHLTLLVVLGLMLLTLDRRPAMALSEERLGHRSLSNSPAMLGEQVH